MLLKHERYYGLGMDALATVFQNVQNVQNIRGHSWLTYQKHSMGKEGHMGRVGLGKLRPSPPLPNVTPRIPTRVRPALLSLEIKVSGQPLRFEGFLT